MADEKKDDVELSWEEDISSTGRVQSPAGRAKLEKRLLRKMDLSIVPLLTLSFLIAYMV